MAIMVHLPAFAWIWVQVLLGLAFIGACFMDLAVAQTITTPPSTTSLWGSLGPCPTAPFPQDCHVYGPYPDVWGWAPVDGPMWPVQGVTVFTAFTVVTVYNTAASTSRLTTIYNDFPKNFTLPEVNSDGTRIKTITYTRFGTPTITVMTYPTPLFDWPDYYGVRGAHTTTMWTGNSSTVQCVLGDPSIFNTLPDNRTPSSPVYLTANPQPTDPSYFARMGYNLTEDPYGLNFVLTLDDLGSEYLAYAYYRSDFFLDQPAFHTCTPAGIGPRLGQWSGDTSWLISSATSTSFEGDGEPPESISSEGPTSSTTIPRPTTTPVTDGGETKSATQGPIVTTVTSTERPRPTTTIRNEGISTSHTQSPNVPQPAPSTKSDFVPGPGPDSSTGTLAPVTTVVSTADDGAVVTLTVPVTSASLTTIISTADNGAVITLTVPASPVPLTTFVSMADDSALVTLTVPVPPGSGVSISLTTIVSTAKDGAVVTLLLPAPLTGEGAGSEETGGPEPLPSQPVAGSTSTADQRRLALLLGVSAGAFCWAWYI
ncbi:hypothetical protein B0T11DRAFT_283416 [Plectosphaerella cucumerina]|uniref:Uncharacterized protein n=1 Tax=Plectosphaerella cucumerina TaxID=40658 RepID=A0A8K0TCA0_9PEZI|nr:hypothetical protein B0T11DRAFT_283416 [Plectosphaerella cucumerina]